MKTKKISILLILLIITLTFFGCQSTDLVAKVAVTSFDTLVKTIPDKVKLDDSKAGWAVNGLDDKERIIMSKDFTNSPDIAIEFDAEPFIKSGLDLSKLPADQYIYNQSTNNITMPFEYGKEKFEGNAEKSVIEAFKNIVKNHRSIIGYHEEGDHYMITLSNGNSFFWAKDLISNKVDMGFSLNPKPFIDAGVDTSKLKDWAFAKMPVTNKDGKAVLVDKFIKGFSIK